MTRAKLFLALAGVALASAGLSAHDFWLAASNWTPPATAPVTITAGVGEHFPTRTDYRLRENWLDLWRIVGANGDVPAPRTFAKRDLEMALELMLPQPGAYLAVMRTAPSTIEMKAKEFTDYLKEEGLERIVNARQAAGEADQPAKEKYSRSAKLAIRNGPGGAGHLTRPIGLPAEFVPSTDPTSVRVGQTLTVQLLVEGKPVAGAAVSAVSDITAGAPVTHLTGADGRATFAIDRGGAWLLKTVHMARAPKDVADWESHWVTLAFHAAEGENAVPR